MGQEATLAGVLLAGIAALASVIVFLYKQLTTQHERTEKRLQDCEDDREDLHRENQLLWAEVADLRGVTVKEAQENAELRNPQFRRSEKKKSD